MKILSGDLIVTSTLTRAVELKEIEEIDTVYIPFVLIPIEQNNHLGH